MKSILILLLIFAIICLVAIALIFTKAKTSKSKAERTIVVIMFGVIIAYVSCLIYMIARLIKFA